MSSPVAYRATLLAVRNVFEDVEGSGSAREWWIQQGIGAGLALTGALVFGTMLRRLAGQWPELLFAGIVVSAALLGLRRAHRALLRLGGFCARGWLDALPIAAREHWDSLRRLGLRLLAIESIAVAALLVMCAHSIGMFNPFMFVGTTLAAFASAFAAWLLFSLRRLRASPARSLFAAMRPVDAAFETGKATRSRVAKRAVTRSIAWLGTWQWRLPSVRQGRGLFLLFGLLGATLSMALVRGGAPTITTPLAALLFGHAVAFSPLRMEPAASPVLRLQPLGFGRLAVGILRLPMSASLAAFLVFLAPSALFAGSPDPGFVGICLATMLALNLMAAACLLTDPSRRFNGNLRYVVVISLLAALAQSIGPLVVPVTAVATAWLFHKAARKHRNV